MARRMLHDGIDPSDNAGKFYDRRFSVVVAEDQGGKL